jgi:hypothetical protein
MFFPSPPEEFITNQALESKANFLFTHPARSIELPDCKIELSRKRDPEGPDYISAEISNPYIKICLKLYYLTYIAGFAYHSPYYSISADNDLGIGKAAHDKYESYTFRLETEITRLFPEVMTQDYYTSYDFAKEFNDKLIKNWDINYFMRNYPHSNKLYTIEYKLDQLIKELKKE